MSSSLFGTWFRLERQELVRLLRDEEPGFHRLLYLAAFTGSCQTLVLVVLHSAAEHFGTGGSNLRYLGLFVLLVAILLVNRRHILLRTAEVSQRVIERFRIRIGTKVERAGFRSYQKIAEERIHQILAESCKSIGSGSNQLVRAIPAGVMIVCSFLYIAAFAKVAFLLALVFLVGMVTVTAHLTRQTRKDFARALKTEEEFLGTFQHLLDGFREVKLHRGRARDLVEVRLRAIAEEARRKNLVIEDLSTRSEIWIAIFFWSLFASIVFVVPRFVELQPDAILSLTTILLFVFGNLEAFMTGAPMIARANVAIRNLYELEASLEAADDEVRTIESGAAADRTSFESIVLSGVEFSYADEPWDDAFSLGPIDLSIAPGETIFLRGGNGTGKTTLLHILAGLYEPRVGAITLDGRPVGASRRIEYRSLFSTIFTDFHLFDRLYGLFDAPPEGLAELVEQLGIAEKITCTDGVFGDLDLSTGQRKRLALAVSLLEDRPIYILDEVAADLDPDFRRHFYDVVLPDLSARGKTLLVGTHDDAYFDRCDRLLRMTDGKIVEVSAPRGRER